MGHSVLDIDRKIYLVLYGEREKWVTPNFDSSRFKAPWGAGELSRVPSCAGSPGVHDSLGPVLIGPEFGIETLKK